MCRHYLNDSLVYWHWQQLPKKVRVFPTGGWRNNNDDDDDDEHSVSTNRDMSKAEWENGLKQNRGVY